MVTRTKIICTIGPSVGTLEKMIALIRAGMNVARLNFSHGTHEEHLEMLNLLKKAREQEQVPLALMLDTKGPEIRLGKIKGGEIYLKPGHHWKLVPEKIEGDETRVSITPFSILEHLRPGTRVMFDDGYIQSHVVAASAEEVEIEIYNGGLLKSGKGCNIPDVNNSLPSITEKDVEDIRFGCSQDIDIIAASFVRIADDVVNIKKLLEEEKKSEILVVAKIENKLGVENFENILQVADGIMVARGDLGVEVPLSEVPRLQKMMIRKSYLAGKPAVTATQMLESMINNPRPTRAEASDVANAIYDSTSAVMLSGETAAGKYPIEAVKTMREIVNAAEADFNYHDFFDQHSQLLYHDICSAVTLATVKTGYSSDAKAIFAFTSGGTTARILSRLRPQMPIVALTHSLKTYHQLAFHWGVIPCLSAPCANVLEAFDITSRFALEKGLVQYGDLVVLTAGNPFGVSGTTNMMMVDSIGDVLVRGHEGRGAVTRGAVTLVPTSESKQPFEVRNKMLILIRCDASYLPLLRECAALILQNHIDDIDSENYALDIADQLHKPVLVGADAASHILKEGQLITLDPNKALIYKGSVHDS